VTGHADGDAGTGGAPTQTILPLGVERVEGRAHASRQLSLSVAAGWGSGDREVDGY
jgi:hypothetical protein